MAGILDKKSRIFDYSLTKEGKEQFGFDNSLNILYATISDRGVVYEDKIKTRDLTFEGAEETFTTSNKKISDSERMYLGFESFSNISDKLNPEYNLVNGFSYPKYTNDIVDKYGLNNFEINSNFTDINASITGSFIEKFKSFKILDSFNQIKNNDIKLKNPNVTVNFDFNSDDIEYYPTIESSNLNSEKIPLLKDDPRFSHKSNFQYLPPVNTDGTSIISDNIKNIPDLNHEFMFKKYENGFGIPENFGRDDSILELIKIIESDVDLKKSEIEISNSTENDIWVINIFEDKEENTFDKLAAINLGEFYSKNTGTSKSVFLFGKIIQKTQGASIKENVDNISISEKEFLLSRNFSFVNVFTLVVE